MVVFQPNYAWMKGLPPSALLVNPLMDAPDHLREDNELIELYKLSNPFYSPTFGIKYIMNVNLFDHQISMIMSMLKFKFPLLLLSRGAGKTMVMAIYAIYHAIMFPNTRIIIVSASFRQSKLVFAEIKRIYANAPILRLISEHEPRVGTDTCRYTVCGSTVTALPLGTGDKIRGERGHVIIADEFDCLHKCLVETDLGLLRIEDIINNFIPGNTSIPLITGDKDLPVEFPDKYIRTPNPVDVYKIQATHGYGFECSKKHKVMTSSGWKLAKDLTQNDYLLLETSDKFPKQRVFVGGSQVDESLAWLMGYLVAEGAINSKHSIRCRSIDRRPLEKMATILANYSNNKVTIRTREAHIDHRGWDCKESYELTLCDIKLRDKLEHLGLKKCKSYDKLTPWSILQSPKEIVISYFAGLFEGDGSAFLFKEGKKDNVLGVAYYSVNERLCEEIQSILLKFGIICNKRIRPGSRNPQCMLRATGKNAIKLFRLLNIQKWNEKIDIDRVNIPNNKKTGNVTKRRDLFFAKTNLAGKGVNLGSFKTKNEARQAINNYIEIAPIYVKVKKVEKLADKQVLYDFHLPQTHSFYANGFRQHNSIDTEIFNKVIRGFGATQSDPWEKVMDAAKNESKEEEPRGLLSEGNKIIIAGTAGYTNGPFYDQFKHYSAIISNKLIGTADKFSDILGEADEEYDVDCRDYCIIKYKYDEIPDGMLDIKLIQSAKATMPKHIFDMEYNAIFADDSAGFFKARDIKEATASSIDGFQVRVQGVGKKQYIMGIDPARTIDRFSVCLIEIGQPNKLVYHWTCQNKKYSYAAAKIRDLMRQFNVVGLNMDSGGGGMAVEELLNIEKSPDGYDIRKSDEPKILQIEDESIDNKALRILNLQAFNSNWIEEANSLLQKNIEDKRLMFPRKYSDYTTEDHEDALYEIAELKKELLSITITYTNTGKKHFNLKPQISKKDDHVKHKDRYSSLLLANYMVSNFEDMTINDVIRARRGYHDDDTMGGWSEEFNPSP